MTRRRIQPFAALALTLLRLGAALALFSVCITYWDSSRARAEFNALRDYDFAAAAETERANGHYSEALLIVAAGLDVQTGERRAALLTAQAQIEAERDNLLRRLREVGHGALTGNGDSAEALGGAVAADLLVIGDVRDLVIQSANALRGEPTDGVIVALSAIGLATTFTPTADAGVAVLKFARRVGAIGEAFAARLIRLARRSLETRDVGELGRVADDAARLATAAQPAAALKILKLIDDPETLHRVADFAQRPGGAFALWLGRERGVEWLSTAGTVGDDWLLRAARHGEAGIDFLGRHGTTLLRPHPVLGLIKSVYRGTLPALLLALLGDHTDALLGLAAGWLLFECSMLLLRLRGIRRTRRAVQDANR
jgi:hypothetical protein